MPKHAMPVGYENFDEIRQTGRYYVDKTEMIYQLLQNAGSKAVLFIRPRRFGKTLAMRMLESFFDIRKNSKEVFQGLAITRHEAFCKEWMNQYPVLFLTFKDVTHLTFEKEYASLKAVMADICKEVSFLEKSEKLLPADQEIFHNLMYEKGTDSNVENSLKILTRMLRMYYEKPVILLIDEYDVPVSKAQEQGFHTEMITVIRNMLSAALKGNDSLKFAVVTGCLRISKESIFTGVNHFVSYSVLDEEFSDSFGFTHEEVKQILSDAQCMDKEELIREWYDGYMFGNRAVYCPWDVVNYVSRLLAQPESRPKSYWVNTSHNGILRSFIGREEWNVHDKFETLLNGGTIRQTISDELTYDRLQSSEDNFWNVLFMTGYLTKADKSISGDTVEIKIPNKEIRTIFQTSVIEWFYEELDTSKLHELMNALWNGNTDKAAKLISDFLFGTISYNDYHEDYYHAFVTGLFKGAGYPVESNREHGLGRTDVVLKDRKNRRAIVIEAKKAASKETLERTCKQGIDQIIKMKYNKSIEAGYQKVVCYSMAFFQKTCFILRFIP